MRRLLVAIVLVSCRREAVTSAVDSSSSEASITETSSAATTTSALPRLDDRCKRHADCEPILVFVDGDARCCPAPSPQAAAAVSAASAFLAGCADLRKNRDCPVPEKTSSERAACVAGHCVIAP